MNADLHRSAFISGNLRLLLSDAMDRSHAPDQRFAIDRYHSATGEDLLEGLDRASIIIMPEHGKKHDVVSDVEVCVTGRQPIELASAGGRTADNTGHW